MSLPLPWDEFDAYLFDIDGTLLRCVDSVHYFAFCEVLSSFAGRPLNLDGVTTHGNTDEGILRDAFALAAIPEKSWRPHLPKLRDEMCLYVECRKAELCATILPSVREALVHLRDRGALLGVATGNLKRIGKRKLVAAGLFDLFHFGAWSDGFEQRSDIFGYATNQVRRRIHERATILAVGDTPADIAAARANGLPILSVATGVHTREELSAANPSLCVPSIADLMDDLSEARR